MSRFVSRRVFLSAVVLLAFSSAAQAQTATVAVTSVTGGPSRGDTFDVYFTVSNCPGAAACYVAFEYADGSVLAEAGMSLSGNGNYVMDLSTNPSGGYGAVNAVIYVLASDHSTLLCKSVNSTASAVYVDP